jgi:hypothetical protein
LRRPALRPAEYAIARLKGVYARLRGLWTRVNALMANPPARGDSEIAPSALCWMVSLPGVSSMRQMSATPSVVPYADGAAYIVLDDLGNIGASYRETDAKDCDRASVVRDLLHGQFHNPIRVIAFNTAEGWSADASEEIARAVLERARAEDEALPHKVQAFCERHTSVYQQADLFAA